MKRVTLEPLDARPTVPLSASPGVADPLVDASRRARALEPVDPRVLGRVDVNAHRPKTTRWVVADPTPPDPKALDARVSALAAEVTAALKRASEPLSLEDEAETKPTREPWPFPAAEEARGGDQPRKSTTASSPGPIRFVERFPVLAPRGAEDEDARFGDANHSGLSYDESSKTWTREVFPAGELPTGESVTSENKKHAKHAHTSREDVRVLERWLDASVAEATRRRDGDKKNDAALLASPTRREKNDATIRDDTPHTLAESAETCDAAIDAFRATFETIALDVFTECRDRAALLKRVWAFNSTFFELRGAATTAPALFAARKEAFKARSLQRRFETENATLKRSLAESNTRQKRMERAHEKQLEKSKTQIFALTRKLRDALCESADARGAAASSCHRENALREELREIRDHLVEAKKTSCASAWRLLARQLVSNAREEERRRANIAVVSRAVRAEKEIDAAVQTLVFETAESDLNERLDSYRASRDVSRKEAKWLKKRVEELEFNGAIAERAAANAVAAALSEARDARVEAKKFREARDDAFCMARESRAELETVRKELVQTKRALGETNVEMENLRERLSIVSTRAESSESALLEARRTVDVAQAAATSREDFLRRARTAAAARDAAIARLIAEVSSVEDIVREEEEEKEEKEDEDVRFLVRTDIRLASASNAAARLLRAARDANDASLREKFALETRLAHVASDAARSASAAATFSAKLKECVSSREALDMKARALEFKLAKRDIELEHARTETENIRREKSFVNRALDDARDVAATLEARVFDRDAALVESTHRLHRSEECSIDSLLVELVLETAYEDTRDDVTSLHASFTSTREALQAERLVNRRREKTTTHTLKTTRRALHALAEETVELELSRQIAADQRDDAAREALVCAEETALARDALARELKKAERQRAAREKKEVYECTRRVEREYHLQSENARAFRAVASAVRSEWASTRDVLLSAIASHRDAREEVRNARAEIEPATARIRDAARTKKSARLARAARRRDAATQSDDAHAACGRRIQASIKVVHL